MSDPTQVLTANGIVKAFAQGSNAISVLQGISLHVAAGERVAIVGRSGSGKSTLLHLLAGLDEADAGPITLPGETMTPASNLGANHIAPPIHGLCVPTTSFVARVYGA